MDGMANGRARSDAGTGKPLQQVYKGEDCVWHAAIGTMAQVQVVECLNNVDPRVLYLPPNSSFTNIFVVSNTLSTKELTAVDFN